MRLSVARIKLREVVKRASEDTTYMKQLQDNPVDTLVKEGFPYDIVEDFLRESGLNAEVSGYTVPNCANSCALTGPHNYQETLWHE